MQVVAVPVKALDRAKTRLAPVLSLPERAVLTLAMLEDVLDACLAQPEWETRVVSRDEAVLEVAARRGARPVAEAGHTLNEAVRQVEGLIPGTRSALAIVLADLPLLTPEALAAALAEPGSVVVAPAGSDGGTNLLLRRPPAAISPRFGRASFAKHRFAARRAGLPFAEVSRRELGFDLDRPGDLARLLEGARGGRTLATCLELGLAERLTVRAEGA
jgi:2-phospho-L-lactate guanylyltransferase